ncbi:MAG: LysM peptidoglycan-binding domain-containing protein [Okeania sp. SIO2C2]|nr:LysM peptidoglycan-binding domain-containing protein [Okeania sp. SIO2C2]
MTKPVEKKPQSDTSVVKTSRGETNQPFRISRKATVSEVNASNLGAKVEAEPHSQKELDLPLPKATNQLSASTVQTKADTSVNPNSLATGTQPKTNPPLVKGIIQTKPEDFNLTSIVPKTDSGKRQVDTHSNSHPTVTETQLQTSRASLPASPETSGTFRISRKATVSEVNASNLGAKVEAEPHSQKELDLPLPKATNQLSASTVQTKADTSVNPNSLVTATQPKTNPPLVKGIIQTKANEELSTDNFRISRKATVSEVNASNLGARVEAEPHFQKEPDLPLTQATNQLSASTVQTKADTSVNPNSLATATQPKTNPPLTLELFFDVTESLIFQDVRQETNNIVALTLIPRDEEHPSVCEISWGDAPVGSDFPFVGVITSLTQKFTLFKGNGKPLRANLSVTVLEFLAPLVDKRKTDPELTTRIIKGGDTLSDISAQFYNNPKLWRIIAQANQLDDPRNLEMQIGRTLIIPKLR